MGYIKKDMGYLNNKKLIKNLDKLLIFKK